MKYKLSLILFIVMFMLNINYVKADSCDKEDIARLKEIANMIDTSYEWFYNEEYNYSSYDIKIFNITEEIYLVDDDGNKYSSSDVNSNGYVYSSSTGGDAKYYVYSSNCNKKLKTITIELPVYNFYSQYDECDGISGEELDVCDEWYEGDLSYNSFIEKVNKYREQKDNDSHVFFASYGIYFIIGGVIFVLLIVLLFIIRRKRSVLR